MVNSTLTATKSVNFASQATMKLTVVRRGGMGHAWSVFPRSINAPRQAAQVDMRSLQLSWT